MPVRLQRVSKSSRNLNNYFLSTPTGLPTRRSEADAGGQAVALFPRARSSAAIDKSPVPAFAVQAIREALDQSDCYGPVTSLAPGEADPYCAEHVRLHGGIVLTSDSDLLVFDLGPEGGVVFFNELEANHKDGSENIMAWKYCPAAIAKRLSLAPRYGMSALAFEMSMDPSLPLNKVLERSRKAVAISANRDQYKAFLAEYPRVLLTSSGLARTPFTSGSLEFDSRVSEFVLQYLQPEGVCDDRQDCGPPDLSTGEISFMMFLPPLLDNWARASAWEISASLRTLAYGMVQHVSERAGPVVLEYRRLLSSSSKGKPLKLPCSAILDGKSTEILTLINVIRQGLAEPELRWIVFSMYLDLAWSSAEGKESTVLRVLSKETFPNGLLDTSSWNTAHWFAQIQGTYYSLRILRQMLVFVSQEAHHLPETAYELLEALSCLPPFAGYLSFNEMHSLPDRVRAAGGLVLLEKLCELDEPIQFKAREKKAKKGSAAREQRPPPSSQNAFAQLGVDY